MESTQKLVKALYTNKEYTSDLLTLGLGLCGEAGELAKAINQQNPEYKPAPDRNAHSIEQELYDCMIYLFGIANSLGINMKEVMLLKLANSLYESVKE